MSDTSSVHSDHSSRSSSSAASSASQKSTKSSASDRSSRSGTSSAKAHSDITDDSHKSDDDDDDRHSDASSFASSGHLSASSGSHKSVTSTSQGMRTAPPPLPPARHGNDGSGGSRAARQRGSTSKAEATAKPLLSPWGSECSGGGGGGKHIGLVSNVEFTKDTQPHTEWRWLSNGKPEDRLRALYCTPLPRFRNPPPHSGPKCHGNRPSRTCQTPQSACLAPSPSQERRASSFTDGGPLSPSDVSSIAPDDLPAKHTSTPIAVGQWRKSHSASGPLTVSPGTPARRSAGSLSGDTAEGTMLNMRKTQKSRPTDYASRYAELLHRGWSPVKHTEWSTEVTATANNGGSQPKQIRRLGSEEGRALGERLGPGYLKKRQEKLAAAEAKWYGSP